MLLWLLKLAPLLPLAPLVLLLPERCMLGAWAAWAAAPRRKRACCVLGECGLEMGPGSGRALRGCARVRLAGGARIGEWLRRGWLWGPAAGLGTGCLVGLVWPAGG